MWYITLIDLQILKNPCIPGIKPTWSRITADLSIETLQARREWQDILKMMKENNLQPRSLYPARISFKYEEEIKSFSDKQKLRVLCTTKPALQQILNRKHKNGV